MKQILDLRPVYHRREDRIRAHVLLCWLALLLIRVAETSTGQTWNRLRAELQRLHAVTYTGPAGTFRQSTEPHQAPARHLHSPERHPAQEDHRYQPEAADQALSPAPSDTPRHRALSHTRRSAPLFAD